MEWFCGPPHGGYYMGRWWLWIRKGGGSCVYRVPVRQCVLLFYHSFVQNLQRCSGYEPSGRADAQNQ